VATPGRRRGRPRLDPTDESVSIHLRIPARTYDALYRRARVHRCSVPELTRAVLRKAIATPERDDDGDT
jgi:hypothetical protein